MHLIKDILMIIDVISKYFIIIILFLMIGCDQYFTYCEPPFVVEGDPDILNDTIINIKIDSNMRNQPGLLSHKMQSLIYKGRQYPLTFKFYDDIVHYTIYYSYHNKVNTLSFDANIPRLINKKRKHQIITVHKENEGIYITYHSDNKNDRKITGKITILQNEYLRNKEKTNGYEHPISSGVFFHLYN